MTKKSCQCGPSYPSAQLESVPIKYYLHFALSLMIIHGQASQDFPAVGTSFFRGFFLLVFRSQMFALVNFHMLEVFTSEISYQSFFF